MNWKENNIVQFFDRSLIAPLFHHIKQGLSPEKLALSVALGISLGIFPIIGTTTVLCFAAAFIFRINISSIQLINYFASPLQLVLVIPFIRFGEYLFNEPQTSLSVYQIIALVQTNFVNAVETLWLTTIHAIVAWVVVGPLLAVALYYILVPVFRRIALKFAK